MIQKRKIIILTYYMFPCHETVLENLFAKELGKEHDIIWLFNGGISKTKSLTWHNSTVILGWNFSSMEKAWSVTKFWMHINKWYQLFKLLIGKDVKIVLIRDQPFTSFVVSLLKKYFGFKVYFQYTAPLGDMKIAFFKNYRRFSTLKHLLQGYTHNIFLASAMKKADIIFPITEFHKNELKSIAEQKKLIPLTMGVDDEWINEKKFKVSYLENIKEEYDIITYFGTMNFAREPLFILNVFAEIKKKYKYCKLLLMGKTAYAWEEKELKSTCHKLGIENDVLFIGHLERKRWSGKIVQLFKW